MLSLGLAMRCVLSWRSEQYGLILFTVPNMNFAAETIHVIDWQDDPISETSILANNFADDIEMSMAYGSAPLMDFHKYPCHTPAVVCRT